MLRQLQVTELALVERATVDFGPGLNLLTGETGSGKSLIVDALGLSLGARASSDQVRQGSDRALVEALFDATEVPAALAVLETQGYERPADLILAREVGRRGAARINGRPASPGQLREVGRELVGIHGQHEHHQLMDPEAQTLLVDAHGGGLELRDRVAAAHRNWAAADVRLQDLVRMQARGQREEEYLRWQLEELRSANLQPGEDEELAAERSVARHAARLSELVAAALQALRSDEGLPQAASEVRAAAELDPRLGELERRLAALGEEAADVAAELRRYSEAIDADPGRLEAIEGRLATLDGIKRKYGGSLDVALAELARLEAQLGQSEDLEGSLAAAHQQADRARALLESAAGDLTVARRGAGADLGRAVSAELEGLRLEGAVFDVRLVPRLEIGAEGAEWLEMLFSANPGEAPAPLARVASGGELSRLMLAIKTVGADADRLPTLVFDEVDAGIGGEAAIQVGLRLKALGRHQVLVVTHLAQIASFADHHLVVEKAAGSEGRNVVSVRELSDDEDRARELARMMSGGVTEKALARARELLEEGRRSGRAARDMVG